MEFLLCCFVWKTRSQWTFFFFLSPGVKPPLKLRATNYAITDPFFALPETFFWSDHCVLQGKIDTLHCVVVIVATLDVFRSLVIPISSAFCEPMVLLSSYVSAVAMHAWAHQILFFQPESNSDPHVVIMGRNLRSLPIQGLIVYETKPNRYS